jgi:hypothetical protein
MLGAVFGRLGLMMFGLEMVAVRDVSVVVAFAVIAHLVRLRGFVVMARRLFVMFGGLGVMLRKLVLRHDVSSSASVPPHHGGWLAHATRA